MSLLAASLVHVSYTDSNLLERDRILDFLFTDLNSEL